MFVTHCRRVLCVQVFTFGPGGPTWRPPPGTQWQLVEDKKADNKDKKPAEKKEEKKEKNPVGDHTTPLIILFI
jgi:hypothetical protein